MRTCLLLFIAVILASSHAFAQFPQLAIRDDFNRVDEDPVDGGIWSNGIFAAGDCQIIGNQLVKGNTGENTCYLTSLSNPEELSMEVYGTYPSGTTHSGNTNTRLFMCLQDGLGTATVDGYVLRFKKEAAGNDLLSVERADNGVLTRLGATYGLEIDDGDKIGLERLENGDLNVYADQGGGWTFQFTRNDTTYSCGGTAIGAQVEHTSHALDDFGGGGIPVQASSGSTFIIIQYN